MKKSDFDDEAKQKIMKYNVQSDESDAEDHEEGRELISYYSCIESSSLSTDEDWHFSREEKKVVWKDCSFCCERVI